MFTAVSRFSFALHQFTDWHNASALWFVA